MFEWGYEFGEVGFDVVIGNPPYIQLQKNGGELSKLYKNFMYSVFESSGDVYQLFFERGLSLLYNSGILSYITKSSWINAKYGQKMKQFFYRNYKIETLIDLSDCVIFENVTVLTSILTISNKKEQSSPKGVRVNVSNNKNLPLYFREMDKHVTRFEFTPVSPCNFDNLKINQLKNKIYGKGKSIKSLKKWTINRGIINGFDKAFVLDDNVKNEIIKKEGKSINIIKKMLKGKDVQKFFFLDKKRWLITTFPSKGIDISEYSEVKNYLSAFRPKIEQTGKTFIEDGVKKKCRKKTNNKWFETQDYISYWKVFKNKKIIFPNITKHLKFALVESEVYINSRAYVLSGESLEYLVGFFNSKLFNFSFFDWFSNLQGGVKQIHKFTFEKIPILGEINQTIENVFIFLVNKILSIKNDNVNLNTTKLENCIDILVYKLYDLTPEEIEVIDPSYKEVFKDCNISEETYVNSTIEELSKIIEKENESEILQ